MYSTGYCCQILMELEFSRHVFEKKNPQIPNLMKIRPLGAEFLHADGADRHDDLSRFLATLQTHLKSAQLPNPNL